MSMDELFERVKLNIEDEKLTVNNVGNRPHNPILVAFSGAKDSECVSFISNLKRTWSSQITKNLLFYRYKIDGNDVCYIDATKDEFIPNDDVYESISRVARTRNVFASLNSWRFYNVIDTANMTFDEFLEAYNSVDFFSREIDESSISMVIVLLKDTRDKDRKAVNYQIRDFLGNDKSTYGGKILVSNRTRGGSEYKSDEMYSVISNIVLLTDNDAVTSIDDDNYSERNLILYSDDTLILSYNSLRKPVDEILKCMVYRLISVVIEQAEDTDATSMSSNEIDRILGIENNKLVYFDGLISQLQNSIVKDNIGINVFRYIPLLSQVVFDDTIGDKKYSEIRGLICQDALELIIKEYCTEFIRKTKSENLFNEYRCFLGQNVNLSNINSVSKDRIREVINSLKNTERVSEDEYLNIYFKKIIEKYFKTEIIYPYCIEIITSFCDISNVKMAQKNIENLERDIYDIIPIAEFDEIASLYGKYMIDFLSTDLGKKRINEILQIDNTYLDLLNKLEQTLYDANNFCNGTINKPFIELWANALKLHDEEIFNRIRNTLNGEGDNEILLRGLYPVNQVLSVYMLHCYDRNGENNTFLYKNFIDAYKNVSNVQFFNTGNDDSIESIQFYRCSHTDLILGLDEPY